MLTDSLAALVRGGEIVQWPYKLRPDAKRLHPEVLRTAAVMRRDSPTIAAFQAALELASGYLDGLFIAAEEVRV